MVEKAISDCGAFVLYLKVVKVFKTMIFKNPLSSLQKQICRVLRNSVFTKRKGNFSCIEALFEDVCQDLLWCKCSRD